MEYEEENKEQQGQEEGTFNSSATKRGKSKILDMMRDDKKKKQKMKIPSKQEIIKKVISIGLKTAAVSLGFLLLTGFHYVIKKEGEEGINGSKVQAISTSYAEGISTDGTDDGSTLNKVAVSLNADKSGYEFTYNNDEDYLKDVRDKLEDEIVSSSANFTDFEIAVLGALMDNGADLQGYTAEELHCFPAFIKAESSTQNLDLRPNSDKQSGKATGGYIDSYVTKNAKDLSDNEVPGTILVQRTNTKSSTEGKPPVTLEYKQYNDFMDIKDGKNGNEPKDALNYFTINEKGNLVIAKWSNKTITVKYHDGIEDNAKKTIEDLVNPAGSQGIIITTEEIVYSQLVSKYTMPFEFLVQLLIITEDSEFCMDVVDCVLDSKIVINIQEEETYTKTVEEREYGVETKEYKYIDYIVRSLPDSNQTTLEDEENYLLQKDVRNGYTNHLSCNATVTVTTENTNHSYITEIIEADTWIVNFKKEYGDAKQEGPKESKVDVPKHKGEFKEIESNRDNPITDKNIINSDEDVKNFVSTKQTNYAAQIVVPTIYVTNHYVGGEGWVWDITATYGEIDGESKFKKIDDLPGTIKVKTTVVNENNKPKVISFEYKLDTADNTYKLMTEIDPLVKCEVEVSKLVIEKSQKVDLDNYITTTVTKYLTNPNPAPHLVINAKDEDGNFIKFLEAYDKSSKAQNQLNSIDSWLFEMMEENEATVELVDIIKYLLYLYDGEDRGVTDLDLSIFEPEEFRKSTFTSNLSTYLRQFSHSSEAPKTADGKYYKMYGDGRGWPTIGNADLQWKSNHTKFNCSGKVLENGVEKTVPSIQSYVNGKLGGAGVELTDSEIDALNICIEVNLVDRIGDETQKTHYDSVEIATRGLDLSKQQLYALVAIQYNFGYLPVRNGYTFKQVYLAGASKYEINSVEHNKYIWDNWWAHLGGGAEGHIPARDAAFETYVKGVYDFSTSDAGEIFGRNYYIYYTQDQLNNFSYAPQKPITRTPSNEVKIFTYEEAIGGDLLQVAKEIHDYMSDPEHLYYYCLLGYEDERSDHLSAGLSCGLNTSFEQSQKPGNQGYRMVCCATYVSWVLVESGAVEYNDIASCFHNADIAIVLDSLGWTKINNYSDLEAGDIVVMDTDGYNDGEYAHVQIYVGDGCWYNAGSNGAIHAVEPQAYDCSSQFVVAYRQN